MTELSQSAADELVAETPAPSADAAPAARRAILPILANPLDVALFEPGPNDRLIRWFVIAAVFLLYVMNCGSFGLWDPWETHYGEVARTMYESYDWVNPWWGYKTQIGTEPIGGEWFYSKPIYIFWSSLTFLKLIGLTDWAFRLPQALLGASMCSGIYLALERIVSRRMALIALAVTALSPFVYMVARQAQTDNPFVATMTIGLCFMAVAIFGKRENTTPRSFFWITLALVAFVLLNVIPQLVIISTDLFQTNAGQGLTGIAAWGDIIQQNGVYHLLFYVPLLLGILLAVLIPVWKQRKTPEGWDLAFRDKWLRKYLLLCGYMLLAQATYAKGLLGFMLPGAILLVYLGVSRQWGLLARIELARGVPLFFLTVMPWYVAMFCRHGMPYYQRFIIHDHFNRIGAGVHEIDTGTFEYFVEWLGYGLFPWSALAPLALIAAVWTIRAGRDLPSDASPQQALGGAIQHWKAFLFTWFLISFLVLTASATRFHHYILPGVPALTVLIAFLIDESLDDARPRARLVMLLGLLVFGAVVVNLLGDYQNLRDLFTYKYDRPMPDNMPFDMNAVIKWSQDPVPAQTWSESPFGRHIGPMVANILTIQWFRYDTFIPIIGGLGGAAMLLLLWQKLRRAGLWLMTATALLMTFWTLNYYMPSLAPHWSQKYLFEAYYGDCHLHPNPPEITEAYTPLLSKIGLSFIPDFLDSRPKRVCDEDIVSWLITWRGETFYSNNEIRPLNKATQLEPYLKDFNHGHNFYALLERGRLGGFESKVKAESKKLRDAKTPGFEKIKDWDCRLISNDSAYFELAKCMLEEGDITAPAKPHAPVKPEKEEETSSPNPSF